MNAHAFRNAVGFALGSAARDQDWGWLFNDPSSQPGPGSIAPVRFVTGGNHAGPFAAIIAVGPEACGRLSTALTILLPAVRSALRVDAHPDVRFNRMWSLSAQRPNTFRITTLVLNRVKGDRAAYDALRADPAPLSSFVQEAVASGLDRQATRVGLPLPGISPERIEIVSLGTLSAQPVGSSGRGMRSRLTQAVVRMPLRLQGDWRVGGLVGYGNGLVTEIAKERHWRDAEAPAVRFPRYPRDLAA